MLNWWEKWGLHPDVRPCDVHFNEWVEAHGISNKLIYHFDTGTHHVIGRRQAELGLGNVVFGITASKGEYEDYISLVIDNPALAKSYLAPTQGEAVESIYNSMMAGRAELNIDCLSD